MTRRLAEALQHLAADFEVAAWVEPNDGAQWRARLAERAVSTGLVKGAGPFDYPPADLEGFLSQLEAVRRVATRELVGPFSTLLCALVQRHLAELEQRVRAIGSRDDSTYSTVVVELDGLPSRQLVDAAWEIVERPAPDRPEPWIPAEQAAERLRRCLARLELADWTVETTMAMSAAMSVNGPLRRVRVRADARFTEHQVRRLIAHEIGGHVLRWQRSLSQPEALVSVALGSTILTEEGLALWLEDREGLLDQQTLRVYAARVVAVDAAHRHGITDVARLVAPIVGAEQAAAIALRAKRGLRHPEGPGGSTKDWSYLGGLRACSSLAARRPEDVELLLGVKWGMEHLEVVRDLASSGRVTPHAPARMRELEP